MLLENFIFHERRELIKCLNSANQIRILKIVSVNTITSYVIYADIDKKLIGNIRNTIATFPGYIHEMGFYNYIYQRLKNRMAIK